LDVIAELFIGDNPGGCQLAPLAATAAIKTPTVATVHDRNTRRIETPRFYNQAGVLSSGLERVKAFSSGCLGESNPAA